MSNRDETLEEAAIPCDVKLPPATLIRAGCKMSTLIEAMELRRKSGNVHFRALKSKPSHPSETERVREVLAGLIEGVERHCNEPGGVGISGYVGARLSDARALLDELEARQ